MVPTVQVVFNLTRAHLGDTQISGGQLFTNTFLFNYWPNAYSALYRYLDKNANKTLRVSKYYNLPANTGYVTPEGMGILNMGKPEDIRDRPILSSTAGTVIAYNVSTPATTPPSVDITATSHSYTTGQEVVTFAFSGSNLSDDINDAWYVQVISPSVIRLLGCAATAPGAAVGQAGMTSSGSGEFSSTPLPQVFDWGSQPTSANNSQLSQWKWMGGAFRFIPSTTARQIKITYELSGNAPTVSTVAIGIDDCADALSLYLAGICAAAKGKTKQKSEELFMRAVGNPSGDETNVRGGAFYSMAQIGLLAIENTRVVMPPYRRRRNVGPNIYGW